MNGPTVRVPMSMNFGWMSSRRRAISFAHKASRHSRSSESISSRLLLLTSPSPFPPEDDLGVVAMHEESRAFDQQWLVAQRGLADIVHPRLEQQPVPAIGTELHRLATSFVCLL